MNLCRTINARADTDSASGRADDAMAGYQQSLMLAQILPRQAREKLHAMRRLVVALKKRQQWDEARRLEKEVFDLTGASPGPQFEAFMIKCGNAANEAGNYTLAELYARQAITEATKRVGEHSMANSTALDALGFSFCQRSRYKEALPCHRQAVRIAEDLLEPSDPYPWQPD